MKIPKDKIALFEACIKSLEDKIRLIEERLLSLEESRNNETKSTAGDKFETGRAMMQIEIDNCKMQLLKAESAHNLLEYIGLQEAKERIVDGSLVETDRGFYFLGIGLGKVKVGEKTYFCISKNAPIGKMLLGKTLGESLSFNGTEIIIKKIN